MRTNGRLSIGRIIIYMNIYVQSIKAINTMHTSLSQSPGLQYKTMDQTWGCSSIQYQFNVLFV